jgi:large subunit ribosomal protein L21
VSLPTIMNIFCVSNYHALLDCVPLQLVLFNRLKFMFAVVLIAGTQFKVVQNQYVYVNRLPQEVGEDITLDQVLLVIDGNNTKIGTPFVSGARVRGKILDHLKGDKVTVFKKKRRKGYAVKRGHRQYLTKLQIESIQA